MFGFVLESAITLATKSKWKRLTERACFAGIGDGVFSSSLYTDRETIQYSTGIIPAYGVYSTREECAQCFNLLHHAATAASIFLDLFCSPRGWVSYSCIFRQNCRSDGRFADFRNRHYRLCITLSLWRPFVELELVPVNRT